LRLSKVSWSSTAPLRADTGFGHGAAAVVALGEPLGELTPA